jgi:hypothetical protein
MHVQFEFTKEDLVDATKRFLKRGKQGKAVMWRSAAYSAFTVAVMVFLVLQKSTLIGLVFGLIAAAIIVLLYPRWHQSNLENRLRQIADEIMTAPGPYIVKSNRVGTDSGCVAWTNRPFMSGRVWMLWKKLQTQLIFLVVMEAESLCAIGLLSRTLIERSSLN